MRYPVAVWTALGGLLSTAVALAAVFWPERLPPETQAAIIAFGAAILTTAAAILGTAATTPMADPRLPAGSSYTVTVEGEPSSVHTVPPA